MDDIQEIKNQASNLRKNKSYPEAIELYKILWEQNQSRCDQWDGWGYAFSLRKIGRVEEACRISNQVAEKWPDFENNQNLNAWCIYDLDIKKNVEEIRQNESDYFKAASTILEMVKQDQYSPYSWTVFKVIDYLEESRVNYPAEYILSWLDRLDPNQLSTKTWQGTDGKGRTIEHASDKEKWYAEKCKALFELGRFQELIEFGEQTLLVFDRFHYRNDKWIKRRIALSYEALGDPETAVLWLEPILDPRAEWFIQFDMARLQYQIGNTKEALKFASEAALNRQDLEFKWKLYQMMGEVLKEIGEDDKTRQHLLLAVKIQIENEWKIPQELQLQIDELEIDPLTNKTARQIERELTDYWKSLKLADLKRNSGKVKHIVSSGKSGFIMGDDNREYYFQVGSFEGNKELLTPGLRVEFFITPSEDPNKKDAAIHVRKSNDN